MILTTWPCPQGDGNAPKPPTGGTAYAPEMALAFAAHAPEGTAAGHPHPRLLVLPALFDEGNRLRRFTVSTMRRLATLGIASVLPDLPGCGESLWPLEAQTLDSWRAAAAAAAAHFRASHVLTIRAASCLAPPGLPGWHYAPHAPASQLRQLLRARTLAAREAGIAEGGEGLLARGKARGLELAGYPLGPAMINQLSSEGAAPTLPVISQSALAAPGLWLRAEPGEDAAQSSALAVTLATLIGEATDDAAQPSPARHAPFQTQAAP